MAQIALQLGQVGLAIAARDCVRVCLSVMVADRSDNYEMRMLAKGVRTKCEHPFLRVFPFVMSTMWETFTALWCESKAHHPIFVASRIKK